MSERSLTIAIDGPAASGKSTVGKRLAERLGLLYFDTGAMYRVVTLLALEHALDLADGDAVGRLAEGCEIELLVPAPDERDGRQYTVRVGERDLTWAIRSDAVDQNVSEVAAHPRVRAALRQQQRRIGERGGVVMVGRDIGTVVMPDAPLKIYLDASTEIRAQRRYEELRERETPRGYEELLEAMRARDRYDSSRKADPLRPAPDAHVLNSDELEIDEVVAAIEALAERAGEPRAR